MSWEKYKLIWKLQWSEMSFPFLVSYTNPLHVWLEIFNFAPINKEAQWESDELTLPNPPQDYMKIREQPNDQHKLVQQTCNREQG